MEQQQRGTTLIFTMVIVLTCAATTVAAIRRCGNCGLIQVPYPLSTGPDCGDPRYKIRCTAGTLWLDTLGGSSYQIKSIDPITRRIIIRPGTIASSACVSTDLRSEGGILLHLNETLPFNITSNNTIFLYNCTDALLKLSHAPLDCSASSMCHSYMRDHAREGGGACTRVGLCCSLKTSGTQWEYLKSVRGGGCAAFESFVNLNVTVAPPPGMRWPEVEMEVEWAVPEEPVCVGPMDCKDLLNSNCLKDPKSVGRLRCYCKAGFKWDPINGLCQSQNAIIANCGKHGKESKDKHCKHKKKKTMVLAAAAVCSVATICGVVLAGILVYKKREKSKRRSPSSSSIQKSPSRNNNQKQQQKEEIIITANLKPSLSITALSSSRMFTIREIQKATDNFSQENLIGSGGFGEVFRATFDDGTTTAIKRARLGNAKATDQVLNEVRILCQVNHRHLVRLLGCCIDLYNNLLIYEYIPNGTLFDHLHTHKFDHPLNWLHRLKIAHQTAQALSYLHSSALPPIYHRDVKSSNILLDSNFDAKVSDFGLSRLVEITEANKSHIFTSAQGTLGYLDPEYYLNFQLTDKSDVYSFGVVLLEILTAKKAIDFNREEENVNLVVYGKRMIKERRFVEIVDGRMKEGATKMEMETMEGLGVLAVACLEEQRQKRPSMKEVADEIEYLINVVTNKGSDDHPRNVSKPRHNFVSHATLLS